jgi:hypothetical protein
MPKIKVTFQECIQDSQEYGSDDEHMVSRVWVDIAVDGVDRGSWVADLKQTVGSDFETGPIEVTRPLEVAGKTPKKAYNGPFDQALFAEEAAKYFRGLVGSQGMGIKLGPGSKNIRMHGNRYGTRKVIEFDATGRGEAW